MTAVDSNLLNQIIADVPILCVGIGTFSAVTFSNFDDTQATILTSHIVLEQISPLNHKQSFVVFFGFIKAQIIELLKKVACTTA